MVTMSRHSVTDVVSCVSLVCGDDVSASEAATTAATPNAAGAATAEAIRCRAKNSRRAMSCFPFHTPTKWTDKPPDGPYVTENVVVGNPSVTRVGAQEKYVTRAPCPRSGTDAADGPR
ncbi:hypothetical protein IFM12275_34070 [Nocardia sputorum]|nr:hypothetical protein IFM12275_34070 [Nocardia sputorum]